MKSVNLNPRPDAEGHGCWIVLLLILAALVFLATALAVTEPLKAARAAPLQGVDQPPSASDPRDTYTVVLHLFNTFEDLQPFHDLGLQIPVSVHLRTNAGDVYVHGHVVDIDGNLTLTPTVSSAATELRWWIKGFKHLGRAGTVNISPTEPEVTVVTPEQWLGDNNDDNVVETLDWSRLKSVFGMTVEDAEARGDEFFYRHRFSDADENGLIDIRDANYVFARYGQCGDLP